MKIDIEGGELNAFRGMKETFKRCPPSMIICELWGQFQKIGDKELSPEDSTPALIEIFDFLTELSYEPMHISKDGLLCNRVQRNDLIALHSNKINAAFIIPQLKAKRLELFA